MLNFDQLQAAVIAAKQRFALIRQKYPGLKTYLVFSSTAGQTPIDSPPSQILDEFPAMIFDDANKARALPLLERSKLEMISSAEKSQRNEQLEKIGRQFKFDGECQVELRFTNLNYNLIWKLQADELVDRKLTPQTKASIRIVLGKVEQFANAGKTQ